MDTITSESELPAVLGYLALAVVLALGVLVTVLAQRARRNARIRCARRGCAICRLRLDTDAAAQREAQADVDAWLDYPQAGNR